jgi:hypothetical protein
MARPTEYTKDLADYICRQLAEGRSLRSICEEQDIPARSTVYDWLDSNLHGFPDQYARARKRQAETMLDEILEIADDTSQDTTITDFGPKPDTEWISRSKLRVDARKWAMSKLAPKKYGDAKSIDLTSKGERITGFTITDVTDDDSNA